MPNKKNRIKSPPLSEVAYQKIKERIVTLKLEPGEQVDEAGMAEQLSIGRTPVREALFRLNAENLMEVVPGRGFFVSEITLKNLKDLFESMLILERSAVALAARRIQPDQTERLKRINRKLSRAWREHHFLRVTLLNSQFHRTIYQAAHNAVLLSYLDNLQNQSQRLAFMCFSKEFSSYDIRSHAEVAIKDHRTLIEFLERGDGIEAVQVISNHVTLFQRRVNHFMLPSLDILEGIAPLRNNQNQSGSLERQSL